MTVYRTSYLPDAVFLAVKHVPLATIEQNGAGFATFTFDIADSDAQTLLQSPDAELCRVYHKTWRDTRRRLDSAQAAAPLTARTTVSRTAKET